MSKGPKESSASKTQARLAEQLFEQTDPIRQSLFGRSEDFLAGDADVTGTPSFLAIKSAADHNFNQAKDNVIARTAPGGALIDALTGLEGNRASTLTQGAGAVYGDELSRAIALGTGVTGQSLGSLGQAGAVQAQVAAAKGQEKAGMYEGIGSGVGAMAGGK